MGLTPSQHSAGGKQKLGATSKMGERTLRRLLITGASSVVRKAIKHGIDDWRLEPLGPEQRHDLLEIAEERYGRGATLITSQLPVDRGHSVIGEPTLADAILDRIIHNAHRLQLKGDSLRKQMAAQSVDA